MEELGIEPRTSCKSSMCSTTELCPPPSRPLEFVGLERGLPCSKPTERLPIPISHLCSFTFHVQLFDSENFWSQDCGENMKLFVFSTGTQ